MPVPVISVGNLTLGGTGKTPMVEWIAGRVLQSTTGLVLVSRGYGAAKGQHNDEAMELEAKLPGVPHLQNPDRVAAAREAIETHHARLVVLDDAFQHRRIARDLDIVMLDALEPFGFEHVFPRGTLREPLEGLSRAHVLALSRADMLTVGERQAIRRRVAVFAPGAAWVEVRHTARSLLAFDGARQTLDSLAGQRVAAFCAIGNPAGFRHTLATCGFQPSGFQEFADHYRYTPADVERLSCWAAELGATALLCTHKDLVKLGVARLGATPLWAVSVELECLSGQPDLEAHLASVLAKVHA
jgi:tetraacyldisaccharide 4'-kinase